MKSDIVLLALVGLASITQSGNSGGGVLSTSIPSNTQIAPSPSTTAQASPSMQFASAREGYQYYHSEITALGKWYQTEKNKLAPLNASYTTLLNKIAYMRANPGAQAAQVLPVYQAQLETMEAEIQRLVAPLLNTYNEQMGILSKQQSYYRRLM